jgi:glycosyltransferase involved in cell wall biosynthesis
MHKSNANTCLAVTSYKITPPIQGGQKNAYFFYQALGKITDLHVLGTSDNEVPADFSGKFDGCFPTDIRRYASPLLPMLIFRKMRKAGADILMLEHPYMGWVAILLKLFCRVSYVIHSQNIEAMRFKSMGKWWWRGLFQYEKWTHRFAAHQFFITPEDMHFAIQRFGLDKDKCSVIPYGINEETAPTIERRAKARSVLLNKHQLTEDTCLMLFNGALSYEPNRKALELIIEKINPLLEKKFGIPYRILVCGGGLSDEFKALKDGNVQGMLYAGFVDDIKDYYLGCDVFLNPVNEGGGIKTKLVEAIGFGLTAISTQTGAFGVPKETAPEKLWVVEDAQIEEFAKLVKTTFQDYRFTITPNSFYAHFSWNAIAKRAEDTLRSLRHNTL